MSEDGGQAKAGGAGVATARMKVGEHRGDEGGGQAVAELLFITAPATTGAARSRTPANT